MGKNSGSGSGIWIWDEQPRSYLETIFFGLKNINSLMRNRDPGWKKFGSEIRDGKTSDLESGKEKIRIRDKKKSRIRNTGWEEVLGGDVIKHNLHSEANFK
jgi:hypothetical protein